MNIPAEKTQENKSQAASPEGPQMESSGGATFQFMDNRPEVIAQRKLREVVNNSPRVSQLKAFQDIANNSAESKRAAQFQAMADNHSAQQQLPIQRQKNNTGLPDNLKSGMENVSGMSLDDVKVHQNSDKPAQLNAHAYAQGTDIHLGPGQEKHLPHELGHVVQQKEGRVKATTQLKGKTPINDDAGLEKEADVLGAKALQLKTDSNTKTLQQKEIISKTTQLKLDSIPEETEEEIADEQFEQPKLDTIPEETEDELNQALKEDIDSIQFEIMETLGKKMDKQREILKSIEFYARSGNSKANRDLMAECSNAHQGINKVDHEIDQSINSLYELTASEGLKIGKILSTFPASDKKLIEVGNSLVTQLKGAAHNGIEAGDDDYSGIFLKQAQELQTLNAIQYEIKMDAVEAKKTDGIVGRLEWADRANNAAGVGSGIEGLLVATGEVGVSLSTVAAWAGFIFGGAGIIFGLIGTAFAISGFIKARITAERLKKIAPDITESDLSEAVAYAQTKASKREKMSGAEIAFGLAAVTAGVLGILAVNIATLGIPAAVLGIVAASIGIGSVITKFLWRSVKKSKQLKEWAGTIVDRLACKDGETPTTEDKEISAKLNLGSLNPKDKKDRKKMISEIVTKIGTDFKSKRQIYAESIIKALLSDEVTEQFTAERIIMALGENPTAIREKIVAADSVDLEKCKKEASNQVSVIMDKMQSWAD